MRSAAAIVTVILLAGACTSGGSDDAGASTSTSAGDPTAGGFRVFEPDEFVALWFELQPRPGTEPLGDTYPAITGDARADGHIRGIAEARGYRPHAVSVDDTWHVLDEFEALADAAAADGIELRARSGFRPPAQQRTFFTARLEQHCVERYGSPCTADQITGGEADAAIHSSLDAISIPGYSSHHTGWVVDIADGSGAFVLDGTPEHEWLSADNYLNAKRHGWAPRYPAGAERLGPEPEPWEYFYAGVENLR